MTKVGSFEGRNVDLKKLYGNVKDTLRAENFGITRDEATENSYHLKANKTGVARIIVGATRNVELVIAGEPNAFAVTLSVGAWGKNLATSVGAGGAAGFAVGYVVASLVAAPAVAVGTVAATGSYVTAKKFEGDFWNKITAEVNKLSKKK
jgi:hypothetical protein